MNTILYAIKVKSGYNNIKREKRELPHIVEHLISYHLQEKCFDSFKFASTGIDFTMYYFEEIEKDHKNSREKFLSYIEDFDFTEEKFKIEKEILKDEIRDWFNRVTQDEKKVQDLLYSGRNAFPCSKSLDNITKLDVVNFIRDNYKLENLVVIRERKYLSIPYISECNEIAYDLTKEEHILSECEELKSEFLIDYKIIILNPIFKISIFDNTAENIRMDIAKLFYLYRNPNYKYYRTMVYVFPESLVGEKARNYRIVFCAREEFNITDFYAFLKKNIKLTNYLEHNLEEEEMYLEKLFSFRTEIKFSVESRG